ncbi:MAG TPA: hypothetical protein VII08_15620 [Myxococcales bacterium]
MERPYHAGDPWIEGRASVHHHIEFEYMAAVNFDLQVVVKRAP